MYFLTILFILFVALVVLYMCNRGMGRYVFLGCSEMFGGHDGEYDFRVGGKNRRFDLFLQSPWYEMVESGKKTSEVRLGDNNKYADLVGTIIKCKNGKEKSLKVKVTGKDHYKSLDEMINSVKLENLMPQIKKGSKQAAEVKEVYLGIKNKAGELIFTDERINAAGGLVVLHLQLVN